MTFDATKPVQTRDGRKARIICTDAGMKDGDIVYLVESDFGHSVLRNVYTDGKYLPPCTIQRDNDPWDLVNIPVRTSTWQNVYPDSKAHSVLSYPSKYSAMKWGSNHSGKFTGVGFIRRDFDDGVFVGAEFEAFKED